MIKLTDSGAQSFRAELHGAELAELVTTGVHTPCALPRTIFQSGSGFRSRRFSPSMLLLRPHTLGASIAEHPLRGGLRSGRETNVRHGRRNLVASSSLTGLRLQLPSGAHCKSGFDSASFLILTDI